MASGPELIDLIRAGKAEPPSGIRTLGLDGTHRWFSEIEPGGVELAWDADDGHRNLEARCCAAGRSPSPTRPYSSRRTPSVARGSRAAWRKSA